jgi:hypothetical protein
MAVTGGSGEPLSITKEWQMSRTSDDLRRMAVECRRLAATCNTPEAEEALVIAAAELDDEALRTEAATKPFMLGASSEGPSNLA